MQVVHKKPLQAGEEAAELYSFRKRRTNAIFADVRRQLSGKRRMGQANGSREHAPDDKLCELTLWWARREERGFAHPTFSTHSFFRHAASAIRFRRRRSRHRRREPVR